MSERQSEIVHLAANYGARFRLPKMAKYPFTMGYDLELDISSESEQDATSFYRTVFSVLRLMINIGRIGIMTKVSLLSSQVVLPKEGHLDATVHVMAHVSQRYNSRLVYDPSCQ